MEGIIKFTASKINSKLISKEEFEIINPSRKICFDNNYIGVGADGIGFGNISFRSNDNNEFIISASATGGIPTLKTQDYSRIISFDISNNALECEGEKLASSESLSHAAIYKSNKKINAVIHIHNSNLWENHINKLPTTPPNAEYGTQAMADAIMAIVNKADNASGVIIMGGHQDGVLSYGDTLSSCIKSLDNLFL